MKKYLLLLALPLALCFAACGDDDDKDKPKGGSESKDVVVIDEDGNASNGATFTAIDDQNFYLDYIKYTVVDGHLVVSGYDKEKIKSDAIIVPNIEYKGTKYKVEEIGNSNYKYYAFYDCEKLISVTIPNTVKSIGYRAFEACRVLTSITIPNSVTDIGDNAFGLCLELKSITIPKSVTNIGNEAFLRCSALTSIKVEKGNPNYDSRNNCNAIIETETNTLITGCKNTIIPNSVTSIGNVAFFDCAKLTSITFPSSLTSIGEDAFFNCTELKSITIPKDVLSIGYGAFGAFGATSNLKKVHFKGKTPPTCPDNHSLNNIFNGISPTIYVPVGSADAYRNALGEGYTIVEE